MNRSEAKRISRLAWIAAAASGLVTALLLLPWAAGAFRVDGPAPVTRARTTAGSTPDAATHTPAAVDRQEAADAMSVLGPEPRLPTTNTVASATQPQNPATDTEQPAQPTQTGGPGWNYLGRINASRAYAVMAVEGRQVLVREGDRLPALDTLLPPNGAQARSNVRPVVAEIHPTHVMLDEDGAQRRVDLAESQVTLGETAPRVNAAASSAAAATSLNSRRLTASGSARPTAVPKTNVSEAFALNPAERNRILRDIQDGNFNPYERPDAVLDPMVGEMIRQRDPDAYRDLLEKFDSLRDTGGSGKVDRDTALKQREINRLRDPKSSSGTKNGNSGKQSSSADPRALDYPGGARS